MSRRFTTTTAFFGGILFPNRPKSQRRMPTLDFAGNHLKKIGRGKGAARWVERLNIHHGFAERFPICIFFHDVIRPRSWADKRLSPALVRKRGNGTVSGHSIVRRKFGTRFPLLYGRFFNCGTLDCPRSRRIFSPLVRADSRLSDSRLSQK